MKDAVNKRPLRIGDRVRITIRGSVHEGKEGVVLLAGGYSFRDRSKTRLWRVAIDGHWTELEFGEDEMEW